MKPRTPAKKYHFMLGTTSRVPGHKGLHYLIGDFDGVKRKPDWSRFQITQRTQSGWHVYTPYRLPLKKMLQFAVRHGADRTWARLALKRGWAFLADKGEVKIPWPVERMVIGWRKP